MRTWNEINEDLQGKLNLEAVKTREQGGTTIPYLPGEFVIQTLNEIFHADGWSSDLQPLDTKNFEGGNYALYMFRCVLTVRGLDENGNIIQSVKTDVGRNLVNLGEKNYKGDVYSAGVVANNHDMSFAGAATDALKRAARLLGNPFGITLYDKDSEDFKTVTSKRKPAAQRKTTQKSTQRKPATRSKTNKTAAPAKKAATPNTKVDTGSLTAESVLAVSIPDKVSGVALPTSGEVKAVITHEVGAAIFGWLSGKETSPGGNDLWEPSTAEERVLQATALFVHENFDAVKKAALA